MRDDKQIIDDFREIVFPIMAHLLRELNYEGLGNLDFVEFIRESNRLCDLAEKALVEDKTE